MNSPMVLASGQHSKQRSTLISVQHPWAASEISLADTWSLRGEYMSLAGMSFTAVESESFLSFSFRGLKHTSLSSGTV